MQMGWHQRTHTEEGLLCGLDGCPKSYKRKETLKIHQRRVHRQGMALNHTDNCSPDSYDDEPPSTSQHSSMTSSPHELACTDPDAQDESLAWLPYSDDPPVQSQGHHIPQHEDNRHGIPTSVLGDYHDTSIHGEQKHTQLVLQEEAVTQQTYGISGTGHPGVAMMTNTVSPQDQLSQQVQQLSINPLCLASAASQKTWRTNPKKY
ncbi:hypothetical protein FOTG_16998 [Fusarium oxysporum f. sp. vasinfectum 25433]|uniref:C2H2-type domain-containing protein n=1 Tax=Fusarium oxysporum f. sp. vasinfectum 25433 TaxID=1089449 RepID=X0L0Z5_FUSOX|nr:hypothetical protein FOTG_16998 [Fusarium oxysporum f. sp. vasinfectum 25433]EXM14607.1 hypothetical protein FOTG_16998 [Fusarium oxysporum f. sp. vasinfectum 25433]